MGIIESIFSRKKEVIAEKEPINDVPVKQPSPIAYGYRPIFTYSYDGEKNLGELGAPINYNLNYAALRYRSWQSYLESEITQTVIKKYVKWIIGSGLKLQSEPVVSVLKQENITVEKESFSKSVEDRFKLWGETKVDLAGVLNLNGLARECYLNSIVGGDVLVIQRLINNKIKIQLVDGAHLKTPFGAEFKPLPGNKIDNGIETNAKGEHIAFYIQTKELKYQKIMARGAKSGREMAFLVYGLRYRLDDNRGIPLISTTLETLAKLDRYKEAAVGSAEERAKIPYFIEHGSNSTGENPMNKNLAKAFNVDAKQDVPIDNNGQRMADTIAVTTNKQVFNMPVDSKIVSMDTKSDINFNDFYSPNVNSICSTIGIPPEVALSKYDSNFSASRAALKDWEHTINVDRVYFSEQFYKKIFFFWLEMNVLTGKISAPGFLNLIKEQNDIGLAAYTQCRFVGSTVPHIDPVKEIAAERLKLGASGANIPLTTAEAATEALNGGDFQSNLEQYESELKESQTRGITQPEKNNAQ